MDPFAYDSSRRGGWLPTRRLGLYTFKRADDDEFEQVYRLNHETFVGEVAQYEDPGAGRLVDKFDHKNTYFIAIRDRDLVGMIAVHDRPPFSTAERLGDPGIVDRLGGRPLEVRLLAVRPGARHGLVLPGLFWLLHDHARRHGHTHLLISGIQERLSLYERLGFRALGPCVPSGRAAFVPMVLDLGRPPEHPRGGLDRFRDRLDRRYGPMPGATLSLLPGPVEVSERVRAALAESPVSHRSHGFVDRFERVRGRLGEVVGGLDVALLCGSGTLANDVVAASLAADRSAGRGLVLSNGEFGDRLARQAARLGLARRVLRWSWGRPWDLDAVAGALSADRTIGWVWAVHLESSTGMLNDLPGLVEVARGAGARLCLDCISSLGATPLDLRGVHLATGSSGKALGAIAGLGIVFAAEDACAGVATDRLPAYLDLPAALATRGPRFTFPTTLLAALDRALEDFATPALRRDRFARHDDLGRMVRAGLRSLGLAPIAPEASAAGVLTTFAPPTGWSPEDFASACRSLGYEVACSSAYLRRRGWVQIATMGQVAPMDLERLFDGLACRLGRQPRAPERPKVEVDV